MVYCNRCKQVGNIKECVTCDFKSCDWCFNNDSDYRTGHEMSHNIPTNTWNYKEILESFYKPKK